MAKKTRLFKIASEINIGKETIVDYLNSKGFDIENKPTSLVTEEMLDAIYDKFKNEKRAAEKQREKLEKHKQLRKTAVEKSTDQEPIKIAQEKVVTHQKPIVLDEQEDIKAPEPTEQDIPKVKPMEETQKPEEKTPETEAPAKEKPKVAEEKPKIAEEKKPEVIAVEKTLEEAETAPEKETEEELESKKIAIEKPKEKVLQEETAKVDADKKDDKSPTDEVKPKVTDKKAEEGKDDEEDSKSRRRKKRKRVAEVEYDEDDQPKLKGLTIVGKISIEKKEKVKKKKPKPIKEVVEEEEDTAASKRPKRKKSKPIHVEDVAKAKPSKKRKRRKSIREMISVEDVDKAIKETMAGMSEDSTISKRSKMRQKRRAEKEEKEQKKYDETHLGKREVLTLTEFVTTSDIANMINRSPNEIIVKCLEMGLMVSINQRLDKDTIIVIADDYGFDVEFVDEKTMEDVEEEEDNEEDLQPRPPIVTIMGHVDHGKTSLLDQIRESNVVAGEAGGITQHIGAYRVELPGNKYITFIDTPGHEAFTAMRARGAHVTDIVILVVAADDSVMPQTEEAISHAQAAGVPIVVAINKIDKPDSQPDRIKQQLSEHGILVEDWGGKYQSVEISAKKGINIDLLMEKILLEAEMLELKANPDRLGRAAVVEANMDKGLGPVATIIVQKGTLKEHQPFVAGLHSGRVRAMFDERNNKVPTAGPSMPVRVTGFEGLPEAGDTLIIVASEQEAKEIATSRQQLRREQEFRKIRQVTLDDISKQIKEGQTKDLNLIIKTDVSGSAEALSDSLLKLSQDEVRVNILHKGVGAITESDVMLAVASGGVIIGFQSNPSAQARRLADQEAVEIRLYNIIYDCINEVKLALEGMLSPELKEDVTATIEIRKVFKISKVGVIAGCYITNGKITRNDRVRVLRDGLPIFTGSIDSLKRGKDDVKEVEQGFECGISLEGFNGVEVGDIIEGFQIIEIRRKFTENKAR
jgi:translation initiation factor IF-2